MDGVLKMCPRCANTFVFVAAFMHKMVALNGAGMAAAAGCVRLAGGLFLTRHMGCLVEGFVSHIFWVQIWVQIASKIELKVLGLR